MPNENQTDVQGERVRIDVAEYRKIHLGTLEVGTDGAITIRRPAKPDAQADDSQFTIEVVR